MDRVSVLNFSMVILCVMSEVSWKDRAQINRRSHMNVGDGDSEDFRLRIPNNDLETP